MIYSSCVQAHALCREAPQECVSGFIDGRNIAKNEIYGFATPDGLLAARLKQVDAFRRNVTRDCKTCSFIVELFV